MAVSDEERIIEALAKARVKGVDKQEWNATTDGNRSWHIRAASQQLAALRALGGDVTMPPAPEPTYTIRLSKRDWEDLIADVDEAAESWGSPENQRLSRELAARLRRITPDPEPGA